MELDPAGYLTIDQVAARFQKTAKTISRWCKDGTLPYIKIGAGRSAALLFDWQEIREQMRRRFAYNIT